MSRVNLLLKPVLCPSTIDFIAFILPGTHKEITKIVSKFLMKNGILYRWHNIEFLKEFITDKLVT